MSVYGSNHMPVLQKMMTTLPPAGSGNSQEQSTNNHQNVYDNPPSLVREVSQEQLMSVLGTLTEVPVIKCEPIELITFGDQSGVTEPQSDGEMDTKPSNEQLNSSLLPEVAEGQTSKSKDNINCTSTMGRAETSNHELVKAFIEKKQISKAEKSQLATAKPVVVLKQLNLVNNIPRHDACGHKVSAIIENPNSTDTTNDCIIGMPLYGEPNSAEEIVLVQDSVPLGYNSDCETMVERTSQDYLASGMQNVIFSKEQQSSEFRKEPWIGNEPFDNGSTFMIKSTLIEQNGLTPALGNKCRCAVEEASLSCDSILNACHAVSCGQTVNESLTKNSDDQVTSKQQLLQNKETGSYNSTPQSVNKATEMSEKASLCAFNENASTPSSVVTQKHKELVTNRNLDSEFCENTENILVKPVDLAPSKELGTVDSICLRQSCVPLSQVSLSDPDTNSKETSTSSIFQNGSAADIVPSSPSQNQHHKDVVCLFLNKFGKAKNNGHDKSDAAVIANQCKMCVFRTPIILHRNNVERSELNLGKSAESCFPSSSQCESIVMSESSMTDGKEPCPPDNANERSVTENICIPVDGQSCCELEEAIHNVNQCNSAERDLVEQEADGHHPFRDVVPRCEYNESNRINFKTLELIVEGKHGIIVADKKNIRDDSLQIISKGDIETDSPTRCLDQTPKHQNQKIKLSPNTCTDIHMSSNINIQVSSDRRRSRQLNYSCSHDQTQAQSSSMGEKCTECLGRNPVEILNINAHDLEELSDLKKLGKRRSRRMVKTRKKRSRTDSHEKQDVTKDDNSFSPRGKGATSVENTSPVSSHHPVRKRKSTSPKLSLLKTSPMKGRFCVEGENISKAKEQSQAVSGASREIRSMCNRSLDVGQHKPRKRKSSVKQIKTLNKMPCPVTRKRVSLFDGTENSNSTKPSTKLLPNVNASCDPCRALINELQVVSMLPCIRKDISAKFGLRKTVFQCSICPVTMKCSADIMTHMHDKHTKDVHLVVCIGPEQTLPLHIGCRHCDFIAMNKLTMSNHFTTYHNVSGLKPSYRTVTVDLDGGCSARIKYKCASCEFVASIRFDIEKHWFSRHRERSLLLICGQCSSFYTHSMSMLICHVQKHNALPKMTCTATITEVDGTEVKEVVNRKIF